MLLVSHSQHQSRVYMGLMCTACRMQLALWPGPSVAIDIYTFTLTAVLLCWQLVHRKPHCMQLSDDLNTSVQAARHLHMFISPFFFHVDALLILLTCHSRKIQKCIAYTKEKQHCDYDYETSHNYDFRIL